MYNSQVNIRYAKSLFLLAKEKNLVEDIRDDIELILQWFEENKDINFLLEHPVIKSSQKDAILSGFLKDKINQYTLSFIKLVVKNRREKHLKRMCIDFIDVYKKQHGIKTAVLTTAFELTRTHKESIKKSIEETFHATVKLDTKLDESIIGGMVIQIDDKQLDLSVARQIQQLKNQFLNIDFNNQKKK